MKVEKGNKVSIEYEGKLDSGQVFDSSDKMEKPFEFIAGSGMVIKGFDDAVLGMEKGEEKEFKISPEEAYGMPDNSLKKEFPRDQIPLKEEPQVGMVLAFNTPDGRQFPAKIDELDDKKIVLNLNHPLAGQNLNFKIKVVNVEEGEDLPDECECGQDHGTEEKECCKDEESKDDECTDCKCE